LPLQQAQQVHQPLLWRVGLGFTNSRPLAQLLSNLMADIDLVQYGVLQQKVESMEAKIDKMETQLDTLIELANKGRGGFWMGMVFVSGISTFFGYISHYWSK
jgi:hypothetical protein